MDRAIEALDRDVDATRRLCEEMKGEWLMLHDLMAESILGLISFVRPSPGRPCAPFVEPTPASAAVILGPGWMNALSPSA